MSYDDQPVEATVAQLRPGMRSVTITFKVVELGEAREVTSRDSGEIHRVVDALVGDSTGIVRVPLWDDAIGTLRPGDTYTLTNGYTGLFRGSLRLNVGRFGRVAVASTPVTEVKTSVDMSADEHESTRPSRGNFGGYGRRSGGEYRSGRSSGYDSSNRGRRGPNSSGRGRRF